MPAAPTIRKGDVTLPPGYRWGYASGGTLAHMIDDRRAAICGYEPAGGPTAFFPQRYGGSGGSDGKACVSCARKAPGMAPLEDKTYTFVLSRPCSIETTVSVTAANVDDAEKAALEHSRSADQLRWQHREVSSTITARVQPA